MTEYKRITELTIDRSRWLRGDHRKSWLLRDGHMCCLGFAARAMGVDWFVAESPEHARKLCRAYYDATRLAEQRGDLGDDVLVFTAEPDDKPLTIHCDDAPPGEPGNVTKTCGEWAAENEPGLLCSTEY